MNVSILISVPLYVIGITEIQFFAYLQLIRYRLYLLNKLLIGFGNVANSKEKCNDNNLKSVYDIMQTKSYWLEHSLGQNKGDSSKNTFKTPNVNYIG